MFFIIDMNGNILMMNYTVSRRLGYDVRELTGKSFLTVYPADRRQEAAEIVHILIRDGKGYCPIPLISKSGEIIPVETRGVTGQWNGQDVLFSISADISDIKFSEEKFSKIFHASAAAMALSTYNDGRLIDVNKAFLSLLGYSREEVIGKTTVELNFFKDQLDRFKVFRELIGREHLNSYEANIQGTRGESHYGLVSSEKIYIQDSLYLLTTLIDIAKSRRADGMLEESKENFRITAFDDPNFIYVPHGRTIYTNPAVSRKPGSDNPELTSMSIIDLQNKYHQLFDLESDSLFLIDRKSYQILDFNKAALDLYGYSREEFLSMKSFAISAEPEKTQSAIKEGIGDVSLRWHRKKDGTIFPVEITGIYFILEGQEVHLAAIRDNTERLRIEQALLDSEVQWKLALEGAGDGIWDWKSAKNDTFFSEQWKTMLGYSENETGTPDEWKRLVHPEDKKAAFKEFKRHLRGETTAFWSECRMMCKNGSCKWILFRGKAVEWAEDGRPCRVTGMYTDISKRKEIEKELTEHRDSLEELLKKRTKELERKKEFLQEVNVTLKVLLKQRNNDKKEMEENFISNIKNLIFPFMEKLAGTHLDERQKAYLDVIQEYLKDFTSPLMSNLQQFNLTPMETKIASLIKNGKSTKEIAQILVISTATVENHRKSIRKKLGLKKEKANLQMKLNHFE